jgi:hypothetical protein
MMENPDQRGPVEEAVSILGDFAAKSERQSEIIDDLQFISSMLLLYTQETLDASLAGNLSPEAAKTFESVTNGVGNVVVTVRGISEL